MTTTAFYAEAGPRSNPVGGMWKRWDTSLGYTEWDPAGNVVTQRPLTADEVAAMNADPVLNGNVLRDRIRQAKAANDAAIAWDFTGKTPTQILGVVVPYVQTVARELNALGRLVVGDTNATD